MNAIMARSTDLMLRRDLLFGGCRFSFAMIRVWWCQHGRSGVAEAPSSHRIERMAWRTKWQTV